MSMLAGINLRPISFDDFSQLRRIHAQAYRSFLGSDLTEDQIEALVDFVHTPQYIELILQTECLGAWINDHLCGTASWTPGGPASDGARLAAVCVDPLFSSLGIARRLVTEIESRARRAGFATLTARSPVTVAPFFQHLGYTGTSRGVWVTPCGVTVPVVHMRKGPVARDARTIGGRTIPALEATMPSASERPN